MKQPLLLFLAALAAASPVCAQGSYRLPENIQDANTLHCFDWTFADISEELPRIAAAGFGAVQISPVQGNCGENSEWFYAYMPYDFAFRENGNGTREELRELCSKANEYGIKIIVDVVANHVNSHPSYRDTWWNEDGRECYNGGINYNSRYSITHGQLGSYGDVNSESAEVQERAKAFIEELHDLGVKGIRWDAAKHIGLPSEGCDLWPTATSVEGLWHYGEILDNPAGGTASEEARYALLAEYCQYMSVTDNQYATSCLSSVKSWILPSASGNLSLGGVPANKIVYWGESHDTYANDGGATKGTNQDRIDRIDMLTACRDGATSLYFSRPEETERTRIRMGQKGSAHCLEAPEIAAVNLFRTDMTGRPESFTRTTGTTGAICVARQDGGAVIFGKKPAVQNIVAENGESYLPEGTYIDKLSGNEFTVTATTIEGQVGEPGVAVLYVDGLSGVDNVSADNDAPARYYDISGRPATASTPGLYIKVRGGKAEKILIR